MDNKHIGSSFDDFLKEQGLYEEVNAKAIGNVEVQSLEIAGIKIEPKTGKVTIPEGMTLDDASIAFWQNLALIFPYAFPDFAHQIFMLKGALKFYAEEENYQETYETYPCECCSEHVPALIGPSGDTGGCARRALAEVDKV